MLRIESPDKPARAPRPPGAAELANELDIGIETIRRPTLELPDTLRETVAIAHQLKEAKDVIELTRIFLGISSDSKKNASWEGKKLGPGTHWQNTLDLAKLFLNAINPFVRTRDSMFDDSMSRIGAIPILCMMLPIHAVGLCLDAPFSIARKVAGEKDYLAHEQAGRIVGVFDDLPKNAMTKDAFYQSATRVLREREEQIDDTLTVITSYLHDRWPNEHDALQTPHLSSPINVESLLERAVPAVAQIERPLEGKGSPIPVEKLLQRAEKASSYIRENRGRLINGGKQLPAEFYVFTGSVGLGETAEERSTTLTALEGVLQMLSNIRTELGPTPDVAIPELDESSFRQAAIEEVEREVIRA